MHLPDVLSLSLVLCRAHHTACDSALEAASSLRLVLLQPWLQMQLATLLQIGVAGNTFPDAGCGLHGTAQENC